MATSVPTSGRCQRPDVLGHLALKPVGGVDGEQDDGREDDHPGHSRYGPFHQPGCAWGSRLFGLLHAAHQSPAGAVLVPNRVFGVNRKAFSHTVNELPSQEV